MKTIFYASMPVLLWLVAGLSVSGAVRAGEVYKCEERGSTVYQDLPCPGNPTQAPRARYHSSIEGADDTVASPAPIAAPPLEDPIKKQRAELYTSLHQAEMDRDKIEKAYQAEVAQAQLRSNGNQLAAAAEVRAINQRWSAQSQEVFQRQEALAAKAQELCPGSKEVTGAGTCR